MAAATDVANLKLIRANLIAALERETEYQKIHGPKLQVSIDGESYDWPGWRDSILRQVETLNKLIQQTGGPFQVVSRGRA